MFMSEAWEPGRIDLGRRTRLSKVRSESSLPPTCFPPYVCVILGPFHRRLRLIRPTMHVNTYKYLTYGKYLR